MALKKVTELLPLWSIETTPNVFDYLCSKHFQSWIICPSACGRCGPALKRKEFCNLFWFHVKSAIYQWFNLDSDLVQKFLKDYTVLTKNGKNIILCWIPSHVGILGNEKADAAAKSALSLPVTRMKLPATDMYLRITKLIYDEWQEVWNCCAGNKLHAIRPTVDYKQKTFLSRRDSVLLNRLRIDHTRLTHSYLLSLTWMWYLSVPTNSETHSGWMCWS